jgi:hypothetical protein
MWLEFGCAASEAFKIMTEGIESFRKWFKEWKPLKAKVKSINHTKMLFSSFEVTTPNRFRHSF